ncbi:hypothetical protein ACRAKI_23870 [Saccharothrix isguenensis]
MDNVAARRQLGWVWGVTALAVVALFNIGSHGPYLTGTYRTSITLSRYSVPELGLTLVATIVGLWVVRRWSWHWPWLLVAGALGKVPEVVRSENHFLSDRPSVYYVVSAAGAAGTALIVLGVLCAASALASAGWEGHGAALSGVAVGTMLFGTVLLGLHWLDRPDRPALMNYSFAALGLLGGVLAVYAVRTGRIARPEHPLLTVRTAIVGTVAALLPAVLNVTGFLLYGALPVVGLPNSGAGVLTLLCACGLAVLSGSGMVLRAATAGLVLYAVAAPLILGHYFTAGQMTTAWPWAFAGLVVGVAVGRSRHRAVLAALACAGLGFVMATMGKVTGTYMEMVTNEPLIMPAEPLIALVVAAATATATAVAPFASHHRALPVVLGPLLIGFVSSIRGLVQVFILDDSTTTALPEAAQTRTWAVLLGIATVMLVVIAVLDARRPLVARSGDAAGEETGIVGAGH